MKGKRAVAEWSPWKLTIVFAGLLLAALAVGLINWASPSPHGYIEFLIGLPLLLLGLTVSGLGIVVQGKPFGPVVRSWGWFSLLAGAALLTWFGLFISGVVTA